MAAPPFKKVGTIKKEKKIEKMKQKLVLKLFLGPENIFRAGFSQLRR